MKYKPKLLTITMQDANNRSKLSEQQKANRQKKNLLTYSVLGSVMRSEPRYPKAEAE